MRWINPCEVTCPRCMAVSPHDPKELLALRAACPVCGAALDEVGNGMRASVDEHCALWTWVQVSISAEERLRIPEPGIDDSHLLKGKQSTELTLRDLVGLVVGYTGSDEAARRVVLEAAGEVAGGVVGEGELDRPILTALLASPWGER